MKRWVLSLFLAFLALSFSSPALVLASEKDIPVYLEQLEFALTLETDAKPSFFFQTVVPFVDSEDEVWFFQPRISLQDDSFVCNAGVGWRRLVGEDRLVGLNLFGDYSERHGHARLGLGGEVIGQVFELRINGYVGLTGKKLVEETASSAVYEKVMDGMDLEVGMVVPYLPWLRIYGSGFWFDQERFDDRKGWKVRMRAELSPSLLADLYLWDDNKGEPEWGVNLRYRIRFDRPLDLLSGIKISRVAFPERDLRKEMYRPVERNYQVWVEKWVETSAVTIEVARGN